MGALLFEAVDAEAKLIAPTTSTGTTLSQTTRAIFRAVEQNTGCDWCLAYLAMDAANPVGREATLDDSAVFIPAVAAPRPRLG
jgi:hypothetical protein